MFLSAEPFRTARCPVQTNPEVVPAPTSAEPAGNPEPAETCAVILTRLTLVHLKSVRDPTPEEHRKNGAQTAGKWDGSAESLSYISLRTGLAVSVTQTGTEEMDVTLTNGKKHFHALHRHGPFAFPGCVSSGRAARKIVRRNQAPRPLPDTSPLVGSVSEFRSIPEPWTSGQF